MSRAGRVVLGEGHARGARRGGRGGRRGGGPTAAARRACCACSRGSSAPAAGIVRRAPDPVRLRARARCSSRPAWRSPLGWGAMDALRSARRSWPVRRGSAGASSRAVAGATRGGVSARGGCSASCCARRSPRPSPRPRARRAVGRPGHVKGRDLLARSASRPRRRRLRRSWSTDHSRAPAAGACAADAVWRCGRRARHPGTGDATPRGGGSSQPEAGEGGVEHVRRPRHARHALAPGCWARDA